MLHHMLLNFFSVFTLSSASVVVIPSDQALPQPYQQKHPISNAREMLLLTDGPTGSFMIGRGNLWKQANKTEVLASSHQNITTKDNIYSSEDSFVRGILEAWIHHQHIIIRPDDIWFTILVQLNFYMVKHANDDQVRNHFVDFKGKKDIVIDMGGSLEKDLGKFPSEIQKRIKSDWLQEWIFPNFTTTVPDKDHMVAGILMMGLMQQYFEFYIAAPCGIPSFTLLGEKNDWQKLEEKLGRLSEFGDEPKTYQEQLKPILTRFVKTFDNPQDPDIRKFWANTVRASHNSYDGSTGPVEGWLNGFQFWNMLGVALPTPKQNYGYVLTLDNVTYHKKLATAFPPGYATAHVTVRSEFGNREVQLFAGMVGKKVRKGAPAGYTKSIAGVNFQLPTHIQDADHSSIQPEAAWFAYTQVNEANYTMPNVAAVEDMSMWFENDLQSQRGCSAWESPFL